MKRKRLVPGRKICERNKRLSDFVSRLRKRFHELEKEEEEFRIGVLKRIQVSSEQSF
jgi:predicted nuclease with TOPRIM domain